MITNVSTVDVRTKLLEAITDLPKERMNQVLDFVLFLKSRPTPQETTTVTQPLQHLEDLWGDFWPEDESVDDFIATVHHWRHEDLALHKELA